MDKERLKKKSEENVGDMKIEEIIFGRNSKIKRTPEGEKRDMKNE